MRDTQYGFGDAKKHACNRCGVHFCSISILVIIKNISFFYHSKIMVSKYVQRISATTPFSNSHHENAIYSHKRHVLLLKPYIIIAEHCTSTNYQKILPRYVLLKICTSNPSYKKTELIYLASKRQIHGMRASTMIIPSWRHPVLIWIRVTQKSPCSVLEEWFKDMKKRSFFLPDNDAPKTT